MAKSVVSSDSTGLETVNPGQRVAVLRDMEIDIDVEAFIEFLDATLNDSLPGKTMSGDSLPGFSAGGSAVSA